MDKVKVIRDIIRLIKRKGKLVRSSEGECQAYYKYRYKDFVYIAQDSVSSSSELLTKGGREYFSLHNTNAWIMGRQVR